MRDDFFSSMAQRAQIKQSVPGAIQPRLASRFEAPLAPVLAIDWPHSAHDLADDDAFDGVPRVPERRSATIPERSPAVQSPAPTQPATHVTLSLEPSEVQSVPLGSQTTLAKPLMPSVQAPAPPQAEQDPIPFSLQPERPEHGPLIRETVIERIVEREQLISTPSIGVVEDQRQPARILEPMSSTLSPHAVVERAQFTSTPSLGAAEDQRQPARILEPVSSTLSPRAVVEREQLIITPKVVEADDEWKPAQALEPMSSTLSPHVVVEREQLIITPKVVEADDEWKPARTLEPMSSTLSPRAVVEREQLIITPKAVAADDAGKSTRAREPAPSAVPPREKAAELISIVTLPTVAGVQPAPIRERQSRPEPVEHTEAVRPLISPVIRKLEDGPRARYNPGKRAGDVISSEYTVESPAPTIHVTIGRIEVRATPAPPAPASKPHSTPVMTLEEYVQRRTTGGQR